MSDITPVDNSSKISRRDFLKLGAAALGGVALGGVTLAALGTRERLRNIWEKEGKIDMMLFSGKDSETNERSINFPLLKAVFPELIHQEKEGYSFINTGEKEIILDFSRLAGEKIRLGGNIVDAAISNIPWEEAKESKGKAETSCGLVCRGNFTLRGNLRSQPEFVGEGLDRAIMFIGSGSESGKVEDIKLSGLNSFSQGDAAVSPSYIGADDINLEVNGVIVSHSVNRPEEISEENAQLTKGLSLHNTKNDHALKLNIRASAIYGLEWDAVYSNGWALINIDKTNLRQNQAFMEKRGAAVGSTFNSAAGKITITDSSISYAKGVLIYTNSEGELGRINLDFENCTLSVAGEAVTLDPGQRAKLRHQKMIIAREDMTSDEAIFYQVQVFYSEEKVGLDFDSLEFVIDPNEKGYWEKLIGFGNYENNKLFKNYGLSRFIRDNFDHFGDISVSIGKEKIVLTREKLIKALDSIDVFYKGDLNPSCMIFLFDLKKKLLALRIATDYDTANEIVNFTDLFYFGKDGELIADK